MDMQNLTEDEIRRRIDLEQVRIDLGVTGTVLTIVSGSSMWRNTTPLGKLGLVLTAVGGTLTTVSAIKNMRQLKGQLNSQPPTM